MNYSQLYLDIAYAVILLGHNFCEPFNSQMGDYPSDMEELS
jgi:hypothetical protein